MDLGLSGKIALVTGASSGIGAMSARILAEEGADVVVSYSQNEAGANQTADAVRAAGRSSWLCRMDVTDPQNVSQAIGHLKNEIDGLDVLILSAGQNIVTPFELVTPEEWNRIMDVNLNGPFYVLQACIPLFRDGASVVTVASVAAHTGVPQHAHYAAAKAGLINLTKSAARLLGPRVRVNCVAPGLTLGTPMGEYTAQTMAPDYAQKKLLSQRFGTVDEIARCIVFVASPVAGFMTGATIDINGGRELR
jgi:3-oxoacyl-[acyl-carrier protein] reductase